MGTMASQIISLTIVYSIVYSGADQSKHKSFASLDFVRGIHRWSVHSPHKGPVTRKMLAFDDVMMKKIYFLKHTQVASYAMLDYHSFAHTVCSKNYTASEEI